MAYRGSFQTDTYDTAAEIMTLKGQAGYRAYAISEKQGYIHDGTSWTLGYALGKILGTGGVPSVVPGLLAGNSTGATAVCTPTSTNLVGSIQLKTGTALGVSGVLLTLTLADGVTYPNSAVPFIQFSSAGTLPMAGNYYTVPTANGFQIICGTVTLAANTTLVINYLNPGL